MKKLHVLPFLIVLVLLVLFAVWKGFTYIVYPSQQVVLTKFGEPIGEPKTEPGLYWKLPFVHTPNRFENRILDWDGPEVSMPTKEKTLIIVDTFARWRIKNARAFLENFREERRAMSRIDDILRSATQNTIASHRLTEVVRTDPERVATVADDDEDQVSVASNLGKISYGRDHLRKIIIDQARPKLEELGLELLDVRFKRINYIDNIEARIHAGMKAERSQIAARFRSEGAGQAAEIVGTMDKELAEIESAAYRKVEEIRGSADAEATSIYAAAYNQGPQAVEFYEFMQTMEVYKNILGTDTTLVLGTDSDLFRMLKGIDIPSGAPAASSPSPAPMPQRPGRVAPAAPKPGAAALEDR